MLRVGAGRAVGDACCCQHRVHGLAVLPEDQNAAIQAYQQGYQNHRIYDFYGGVVKFRQLPYFDSYAIYRATSKQGLAYPHRMGNASAYASIKLQAYDGFCTYY